jgi:hypothetical protein
MSRVNGIRKLTHFRHLGSRATQGQFSRAADTPHTREAVICSAWGQDADWIRNIRAHPALQVQIGR